VKLNLSRQSKLVPETALTDYNFEIFGIGSIGSHVCRVLAKSGFKNIKVYDMDIVDEENIGPQVYNFSHIKMNKVDALKSLMVEESGIEIETAHGIVDEKTEIIPEPNTIYCCFFDHFEGRKIVLDKLKGYNVMFIDGRIGRYDMRHYMVNCGDTKDFEDYSKTIKPGKGSELVCGEKASNFINYTIAGLIVSNIISLVNSKPYTKIYIGHALDHTTDIEIKK